MIRAALPSCPLLQGYTRTTPIMHGRVDSPLFSPLLTPWTASSRISGSQVGSRATNHWDGVISTNRWRSNHWAFSGRVARLKGS